MKTYQGGCHCGRVKFEVDGPQHLTALECNCSICSMSGFLHVIVRKEQFRLETDVDTLNTYQFNTYNAQHIFCPKCGVKSFYIPRSHPDWTPAEQLRGAVAAYNTGAGRVRSISGMDRSTTGKDYSSDVWVRAQTFASLFSEHLPTT